MRELHKMCFSKANFQLAYTKIAIFLLQKLKMLLENYTVLQIYSVVKINRIIFPYVVSGIIQFVEENKVLI